VVRTPRTFSDVADFIADFEALRLPKSRWTHEGHLVAGLWYVMREGRIAEVRAYYLYDDSADTQLTGFPYRERDYLGAAQ
jgi:hypothetical protein